MLYVQAAFHTHSDERLQHDTYLSLILLNVSTFQTLVTVLEQADARFAVRLKYYIGNNRLEPLKTTCES